jgi:hypothetical protein
MFIKKILIFCIILIGFFCLQINGALAVKLEVQYPILQTGATLTPQSDLAQYLKYIFDLGMFVGFLAVILSLVWAGILYFLSPIPGTNTLASAKDRVAGAISGLLILILFYLIITTINPHLAIFKLNRLSDIPPPPPSQQSPSVNFYNSQNCSDVADKKTTSIPDFGSLKNKINSVNIFNNTSLSYISILYDITNYWGKCQYINPNELCTPLLSPFAASASIHEYSFSPKGNVVFNRKPLNGIPGKEDNKRGGFLQIDSSNINRVYVGELEKLYFGPSNDPNDCTVPEEEQDCVQWDNKNKCIKKQCPSLAGENISSIEINGNYIVVLVYFDEKIDTTFSWSYCQEFPTINDVNKEGPKQIKWDAIRNRGQYPNFVVIIPVAQK